MTIVEQDTDTDAIYWNAQAIQRRLHYSELENNPFATAFTYGRHKLHFLLEGALRPLGKTANILDIGCGTGHQLRICRGLCLNVTGLEPSPDLRTAAQELNPDISIVDGSVTRMPFDNQQFDFAYAIEVLRYLRPVDRYSAYAEVLRILKPGGTFFFTMANRFALDGFALYSKMQFLGCHLRGRAAPPQTDFTTPAAVRAEFAALGVRDVTFMGCVLGPLRIAYRAVPTLAPKLASWLEPLDDALFRRRWAISMAGHLVVAATRPVESTQINKQAACG